MALLFKSTKKYTAAEGLSAVYRNWRATHSHCSKLHGYALSFTFWFERKDQKVDNLFWVQDFGQLKPLKDRLKDMFDHKLLLALDDPEYVAISQLEKLGIIEISLVENVSCEAFALLGLRLARQIVNDDVRVLACQVHEHEGNSASVEEEEDGRADRGAYNVGYDDGTVHD